MKTISTKLNNSMLIELARTDAAMKFAVKRNLLWAYEQVFDERMSIISSWLDHRVMSEREWMKLLAWCDRNKIY